MSSKTASIKLTMNASGFLSGLRAISSQVNAVGDKWSASLGNGMKQLGGPMKAGWSKMTSSMKESGQKGLEHIKTVGALGAGLVGGAMVMKVIESEKAYMALGSQVRNVKGDLIGTAAAQGLVASAASNTKATLEEVRGTALALSKVGPPEKVQAFTERAIMQARRLGVETEQVARSYAAINAKGMASTAEEAERMVETFSKFGREKLGVAADEAINPTDMAEFASFVNAAGTSVEKLTAVMRMTGNTAKDMGQSMMLIEELGNKLNSGKGLDEFAKASGMAKKDLSASKGALENLFTVLEKGGNKGISALLDTLPDIPRKAMDELLGAELSVKVKGGKATKEELQTKAKELRAGIDAMVKASATSQKEIDSKNKEILNSKSSSINDALNKLELAFSKPEMMNAIDKLVKLLPGLAENFATMLEFISNHPLLAGSIAIGAKAGLSFGQGALGEAGAMLGQAAKPYLLSAASSMWAGATGPLTMSGTAFGVAGGVALVAAAGAIGFVIGKAMADSYWNAKEAQEKKTSATDLSATNALGSRDNEQKKKALAAVQAQIAEINNSRSGIGGAIGSAYHVTSGALASLVDPEGAGTYKDSDSNQVAQLEAQARALQASIKASAEAQAKSSAEGNRAAVALSGFTTAAKNATTALGGVGGGAVPGPRAVTPGHGPF